MRSQSSLTRYPILPWSHHVLLGSIVVPIKSAAPNPPDVGDLPRLDVHPHFFRRSHSRSLGFGGFLGLPHMGSLFFFLTRVCVYKYTTINLLINIFTINQIYLCIQLYIVTYMFIVIHICIYSCFCYSYIYIVYVYIQCYSVCI